MNSRPSGSLEKLPYLIVGKEAKSLKRRQSSRSTLEYREDIMPVLLIISHKSVGETFKLWRRLLLPRLLRRTQPSVRLGSRRLHKRLLHASVDDWWFPGCSFVSRETRSVDLRRGLPTRVHGHQGRGKEQRWRKGERACCRCIGLPRR